MRNHLFDDCFSTAIVNIKRHRVHILRQKRGSRANAIDRVSDIVPSHYDDPDRMARRFEKLGHKKTAKIFRDRLPRSKRARSADLGELLATEYVNAMLEFEIPIHRLRWKDGREMPLRGDDLIGLQIKQGSALHLLKGEVKSGARITASTIC